MIIKNIENIENIYTNDLQSSLVYSLFNTSNIRECLQDDINNCSGINDDNINCLNASNTSIKYLDKYCLNNCSGSSKNSSGCEICNNIHGLNNRTFENIGRLVKCLGNNIEGFTNADEYGLTYYLLYVILGILFIRIIKKWLIK